MLLWISARGKEQWRQKGESILHPQHSSLKNAMKNECKDSKEPCHAKTKGVFSPFSQQGFYVHNLSVIGEWIPLCFHSKESAPGQHAGIFQLKHAKMLEPLECVMGTRQLPLRLAASAVSGALCMSVHICIFRELPVSTKIQKSRRGNSATGKLWKRQIGHLEYGQ